MRAEALAIAAVALLAASAARADDHICRNGDFPSSQAPFGLAKVTGVGRLGFLNDTDPCPNETAACHGTGYVVAGDEVLTGLSHGAYVCAFYPNRFAGSAGWVRAGRLSREPVAATPPLTAWTGQWTNGDDSIDLKTKGADLVADGMAFWPSAHTDRPGGPHDGEFGGQARPTGAHAVFKDGSGEYACVVTLDLVGRYLVASDNSNCGGMNVRFDGVYVRH